ncbi:hypothetical protein JCM10207_001643 [Rhodosporidiobolus poonsookiae]
MSGLTTQQQATYDALTAMGFDPQISARAARRFGSNAEAAADWVMNDPAPSPPPADTDTDAMPPLVSGDEDEPPPHPDTIFAEKPPPYTPGDKPPATPAPTEKKLPAPYVQPKSDVIDLTGSDDFSTAQQQQQRLALPAPPSSPTARLSTGDDDMQRAIAASQQDADDDFSKAMALSMATLGSADEEQVSVVDGIKPEERVRDDLSVPPILRSTSAFQSGLAAYLQALFALPSWRAAILSYRTPDRALLSRDDYTDYWRGDGGLGMPMPAGEQEAREDRLIALQRLFALMTLTRRAFLHITEVARAFQIRESDFSEPGGDWVYKLKEIHDQIVDDLGEVAKEEATRLVENGASSDEAREYIFKMSNRFSLGGRSVRVDEDLADPLPPLSDTEGDYTSILDLTLNPAANPPPTLFNVLDEQLVGLDARTTPPTWVLQMLTNAPSTLLLHLQRHTHFTSLATFGTGAAKAERKLFRPSPSPAGGDAEAPLWLDRYHVENRVRAAEGREVIKRLGEERAVVERRRRVVGLTKDGRDARELVRASVEVLQRAADGEADEGKDGLRRQWEKVGDELDKVLSSYDSSLTALDARIASIFDAPSGCEGGEMHRVGPYRLCAILMRNGLNGRGSAWSVVRGEDGRWWKIVELVREEITLEKAMNDPSGLMMDAGATFLFYQKATDDLQPAVVPPHLARIAHLDNHALASSLPSSSAALISSWSLPPLDTLAPEPDLEPIAILPSGAAAADLDDGETVRDIALSPSPVAEEITVDEPVQEQLQAQSKGEEVETPMSMDETDAPTEQENPDETLRLRGGASVQDATSVDGDEEDEEDYDDDEIDEDEVELGLLAPMPDDWDVDFAVGKVGGRPVWLDPRSPLAPEDVTCGQCGRAMSMLLQVNSPDDTRPHAAARSLYVFACRGKDCLSRGGAESSLRVWRTQMESPNAFYPHTEATLALRRELEGKLDAETGLRSKPEKRLPAFPEFDIAAEPEPYEESYLPDPSTPAGEKEEGTEDAAEPDTKTGVDSAFLIFQERIEREPKQVLRFYRLPGIDDPQPLWASKDKIRPEQVPTCELCRSERKVEFQILSTLLPSLSDDNLDFDSLLVYTCTNNCQIPKRSGGETGWAAEVAFKQDFASEGVKFGGLTRGPTAPPPAQALERLRVSEE